ncbi:MAG: tetratricopeptide repeat protein [Acidobacteriota bacterium]
MKRRGDHSTRAFFAALCCLFGTMTANAQTQPSTGTRDTGSSTRAPAPSHIIRGKIFLPSGQIPDQRLRVVLELSTGGVAQEVFSDSIGNFEFRQMPSNSYRVVVPSDHQSFETASEVVEVFGNFSRTFSVQVYLREKAEDMMKTKDRILTVAELQEVPKPAKKLYEQGLKRTKENKPAEAIKQFEEALKNFPDYLLALNKLGEQYLAVNEMDKARATFERAVAVNGKYPLARINLGMLLFKDKAYPEAIAQLEEAIHSDEGYPMAHLYLGLSLMEKPQPEIDRAEKELLRAVDAGGKEFSYVRLHLFNLNLRRQNLEKAVAQLEAYLKETPEAPNAAQVREKLGNLKKTLPQQTAAPNKP